MTEAMDERTPERIGRFDDFGGKLAYPPKGWVMTADGWKQIQRPPWSVRNEYPTAYPYLGPVLGSPLSTPAASALAAANAPRIAVNDTPDQIETRTHRVVGNNQSERFARVDAAIAASRLERKGRFRRRLSVVLVAPPVFVIGVVLSALAICQMVVVGVVSGALKRTVNDGLVDLRIGWTGLFEVFGERWAR